MYSALDPTGRGGRICFGIMLVAAALGLSLGLGLGLGLKSGPSAGGGSGNGGSSSNPGGIQALPYVTPPVSAAVPQGLKAGNAVQSHGFSVLSKTSSPSSSLHRQPLAQALSTSNIRDRFFNPSGGPTNLFDILLTIDGRIQGINQRLDQFTCLQNPPTAFVMTTWGTNQTFYAQCSEAWQGNQGFDQFAIVNHTFYLYVHGGDGYIAAKLTGWNATHTATRVDAWMSVGVLNRNGSHAVVQILALPDSTIFEMSVAGANVGYCGAQLRSTNHTINITGSEDGPGCSATDSACILASDISQSTTCDSSVNTFVLPALGRRAYGTGAANDPLHVASQYPGGSLNQVVLSNIARDDTFFGPDTPVV